MLTKATDTGGNYGYGRYGYGYAYGYGYGYGQYGYGKGKVKANEILMIPRSEDERDTAPAEESDA